jgi:ankyrin repeat protein
MGRCSTAMVPLFVSLQVAAATTTGSGASAASLPEYEKHELATAAEAGDVAAVRALIDGGAVVDQKDRSGRTALHHAARRGHLDVLELLLEHGADTEARTATGYTALHEAGVHDQFESAKILLNHGADKEAKTSGGHGVLTFGSSDFKEQVAKHADL